MEDRNRELGGAANTLDAEAFKGAIIGGGPGGMFTAWRLAARAGPSRPITVYEASDRLGGKIQTGQFAGVGPYEAGVAETYDCSRLGPDPLHDLIVKDLGLQFTYVRGGPCVLDGKIILDPDGLAQTFGERARDEVTSFRKRAADLISPEAFYFSIAKEDNEHPWAGISGAARPGQWYEDPESLLYCVCERASKLGPSILDEAPAEENPPKDSEEYDDVALIEAW